MVSQSFRKRLQRSNGAEKEEERRLGSDESTPDEFQEQVSSFVEMKMRRIRTVTIWLQRRRLESTERQLVQDVHKLRRNVRTGSV